MTGSLFVFLIFAVFFAWLFFSGMGRKVCPECKKLLPLIQSPLMKTKRQWLEGGYLCRNCGCETNFAGEKVAPGTAPRPDSVLKGVLLVTPFAVTTGVLLFFVLSTPQTPQAPEPLQRFSAAPQPAVTPQPSDAPPIAELGR